MIFTRDPDSFIGIRDMHSSVESHWQKKDYKKKSELIKENTESTMKRKSFPRGTVQSSLWSQGNGLCMNSKSRADIIQEIEKWEAILVNSLQNVLSKKSKKEFLW